MTKEQPYRLILTLPKYHEDMLKDISEKEGLSYAEILRLGLIDFNVKIQIKHNPNPFKVMHGKQFAEPQTIEECLNTICTACAYKQKMTDYYDCEHYNTMKEAEK